MQRQLSRDKLKNALPNISKIHSRHLREISNQLSALSILMANQSPASSNHQDIFLGVSSLLDNIKRHLRLCAIESEKYSWTENKR